MTQTQKDYPAVTLATGDGRCALEVIPEYGGLFNSLVFEFEDGQKRELIAGLGSLAEVQNNNYFRGVALYPFANRLKDGRYNWQGKSYQLSVNEQERNNNLHGLLYQLPAEAEIIEQGQSRAQLKVSYHYDGSDPGYPFAADIWMTYTLCSDPKPSLELEMGVTNLHEGSVPVGIGWHPYFQLGDTINELQLRMPPSQKVLVDARLLPTGEVQAFEEFSNFKKIGDTELDTCFALRADAIQDGLSKVIICSQSGHTGLEIWQETGAGKFNFIQVCTPPGRQSIAIEPVSCGIDAFNTQQGLYELAPEQTMVARCGVRVTSVGSECAEPT